MGMLKAIWNYPAPTEVSMAKHREALTEIDRLNAVIDDMEAREIEMQADLANWRTWCNQMVQKYGRSVK